MKYYGEYIMTLTYEDALEACKVAKKKLPKRRRAVTLGGEGNVIFQLVNTGRGTFDIEGVRL